MKKFLLLLIRVYQRTISANSYGCCRFVPTCSAYTYEAIEKFGCTKGLILGIKRFCKCNPFYNKWGLDPVPDEFEISFKKYIPKRKK